MRMNSYGWGLWLAALLLAPLAHGAPATSGGAGDFRFSSVLEARANPLGIGVTSELAWRVPLWHSDNVLLRGAYIEAGAIAQVSPASIHPGLFVRVSPIAPLVFRLSAQQLRYFGLFGNLSEYTDGVDADWSPDQRDRAWDEDLGRHETGYLATAQAILQLKFGPALAFFEATQMWVGANIADGSAWYESSSDLLVGKTDRINLLKGTVGAVLMGEVSEPEFVIAALHWQGWRTETSEVERQIGGALLLWRPGLWEASQLTFGTLLGVYLDDPYRAIGDVGLPDGIYAGAFAGINFLGDRAK
ncbi:MAG: hypothetical protein KC620_17695 [Myxococcales bacterium]|nr:hypothetical protein [Myxococcales bacterium]